jgi:hypothetical protein
MSRAENVLDQLKGVLPGGREKLQRERGKALAENFDKIKPQLRNLGVAMQNTEYLGEGNKRIVTIELLTNKGNENKVREILTEAGIREVADPYAESAKWASFAQMTETEIVSGEILCNMRPPREIILYKGECLENMEDWNKLLSLEPNIPGI